MTAYMESARDAAFSFTRIDKEQLSPEFQSFIKKIFNSDYKKRPTFDEFITHRFVVGYKPYWTVVEALESKKDELLVHEEIKKDEGRQDKKIIELMERENAFSKQLTMKESEMLISEEKEALSRQQLNDQTAEITMLRERDSAQAQELAVLRDQVARFKDQQSRHFPENFLKEKLSKNAYLKRVGFPNFLY